jgi:hypothetical protein
MKYRVSSSYVLVLPSIASVSQKENTVSVTGAEFYSSPKNAFKAYLRPAGAENADRDVEARNTPAETVTSFTIDLAKVDAKKAGPGCYSVVAAVGTRLSLPSKDLVRLNATPKIKGAKLVDGNKSIEISGDELVSTKECGGAEPQFEVLDKDGKVLGKVALSSAKSSGGKLTIAVPTGISDAKPSAVQLAGTKDPTQLQ